MIERNAGLPSERRIEYRIGIHLGDVVEEADGDLMGHGVNIAARLEGVARAGTICLSEQAYWQVKGRLDLKITDLGNTQLKNIAEPIHVYSLEVGQQVQVERVPSAISADHQAAIKRIRAKRAFRRHATVYVAVNLFFIAVWALTRRGEFWPIALTGRGEFWPIWPVLGWGLVLGRHYWTVFRQRPISQDEIRRQIEKGPPQSRPNG
jgi:hypothetical protein